MIKIEEFLREIDNDEHVDLDVFEQIRFIRFGDDDVQVQDLNETGNHKSLAEGREAEVQDAGYCSVLDLDEIEINFNRFAVSLMVGNDWQEREKTVDAVNNLIKSGGFKKPFKAVRE